MLSKITVLLCLCFTLATASAAGVEDGWMMLRNHAEEARSVLSTIPEQCTTGSSQLVTVEYYKALYSIFNCSYTEVINQAANIALETGAYVAMDYTTVSKLLAQFTSCATQLNPLKAVECDYRELVNSFSEIKSLFVSTKNFIADMKSLIPPLKIEIDNCLKLSSDGYKMFLNNLINTARTCEKNL